MIKNEIDAEASKHEPDENVAPPGSYLVAARV
jgi:hypothetical protein